MFWCKIIKAFVQPVGESDSFSESESYPDSWWHSSSGRLRLSSSLALRVTKPYQIVGALLSWFNATIYSYGLLNHLWKSMQRLYSNYWTIIVILLFLTSFQIAKDEVSTKTTVWQQTTTTTCSHQWFTHGTWPGVTSEILTRERRRAKQAEKWGVWWYIPGKFLGPRPWDWLKMLLRMFQLTKAMFSRGMFWLKLSY